MFVCANVYSTASLLDTMQGNWCSLIEQSNKSFFIESYLLTCVETISVDVESTSDFYFRNHHLSRS